MSSPRLFTYCFSCFIYTGLIVLLSSLAAAGNVTQSDGGFRNGHVNSLDHASSSGQDSLHRNNALLTLDSLVFASTLDGTLFALSKTNGKVIWTLKEDPVLKIPLDVEKGPVFVASPKDGSIYSFKMGFDGLKKLPFSIPDLVTVSPCRSSDGLLYTGAKIDTWFAVDPLTGTKIQTLNMDGSQKICPSGSSSTVFIGRSEYKVVMFDSETRQPRWNATFTDYSSHAAPDSNNYDLQHFACSSSGLLVTMDPETSDVIWSADLLSPVVAMYTLNQDNGFQRVPFVNVAKETLYHISGQMISSEWRKRFLEHGKQQTVFYPTLYVGEHDSHLYALPSFVDVATVTVTPKNIGRLLLAGPTALPADSNAVIDAQQEELVRSSSVVEESNLILLGHHELPDLSSGKFYNPRMHLITDKSTPAIISKDGWIDTGTNLNQKQPEKIIGYNTTPTWQSENASEFFQFRIHLLLTAVVAVVIAIFLSVLKRSVRDHHSSSTSLHSSAEDGQYMVGKITFNTNIPLGRGCDGTSVFQGQFDGRDVAVKRLLRHNFSIADQEVNLLRESDQHHNVIRYYCTEVDVQFIYVALELCMGTVYDYVEMDEIDRSCISERTLLQEMMAGIAHLHLLNIVHRDVKPQNVLLSRPCATGQVRAMISDFGLCKKLSSGRVSMSKVSGIKGTEGWIAPEMLKLGQSITRSVDIFSAGCVLYYVLSNGQHPFSDEIHRQANILNDSYSLSALSELDSDSVLAKDLVMKMIDPCHSNRPNANTVLKHPFFWSPEIQFRFIEAVSNRLEKVDSNNPMLLALDGSNEAHEAVKQDWNSCISEDLRKNLRQFRGYKGHSVRDLLRAIRNKHSHHAELDVSLQQTLGKIPNEFMKYFTSRFPKLLLHTYKAMSDFSTDDKFMTFYSSV